MGQQVTFTIPKKTLTKMQQMAEVKNKPLDDVLAEAVETLESMTVPDNGQSQRRTAMLKEEAAFRRLHPQLLTEFPEQYVAIFQGNVVDHDPDQGQLILRKRQNYPEQVVLIAQVLAEPEEVYYSRSPRLKVMAKN